MTAKHFITATHWGIYRIVVKNNKIIDVLPNGGDSEPSAIGKSIKNMLDDTCRIGRPAIRKSFLKGERKTNGRGTEPFVEVDWDDALDLAAETLQNIRQQHGNQAIYGGSYGWASAGRFHHAQSQIHGFLNLFGGYTRSINDYSDAAAQVITPRVLGMEFDDLMLQIPTWEDINLYKTQFIVCFGGIPIKNTQVNAGGIGSHHAKEKMLSAKKRGIEFLNISPIKDDLSDCLSADWWPIIPNTDVAVMLAIAHTLLIEGLHNKEFLNKYCVGFDEFKLYLTGEIDGEEKNIHWASRISGIEATKIKSLAIRMANERTLITTSWSLQRAEHGEQPYWMATVLGAMLGNHGLPGAGVGYGCGATHGTGFLGRKLLPFSWGSFGYGPNPIDSYIPVARLTDMLVNPGASFKYNGFDLKYPDIKLIYWAGGNPFHHHQDLNRLRSAWQRPECVIVHDFAWTTTARHADIVFPATSFLERNDFSCGKFDHFICPMHQAIEPYRESRSDFDIFTGLSRKLGMENKFTQGKGEMDWVRHLYKQSRLRASNFDIHLPEFDQFWNGEPINIESQLPDSRYLLEAFREDPVKNPLKTPSGKIEIYSKRINEFGYKDCPGHPVWLMKEEFLGNTKSKSFPLHLISNQPKTRLHSQIDFGETSRSAKIKEREPTYMHPEDALERNIKEGDLIRIFNDRGACLSVAVFNLNIRKSVVQLATGAWCDFGDFPDTDNLEVHGNPNVLTLDKGTSMLSQGPIAHSCLVQMEKYIDVPPPIKVFDLPDFVK